MRNILSNIKSFCVLAVLAATSFCGTGVSAAEAGADPERTYYIVYHDDYKNIIRRDPYKAGYTFDADDPFFFVALPISNTAWCDTFIETRGVIPGDAKIYNNGDGLDAALTEDLHVYPVTSYGKFVRFDSQGGTPVHYQFVHVGNHAEKPSPDPEKTGYTFGGWYDNAACTGSQFDFENTVIDMPDMDDESTHNITLYAKWNSETVEYKVHIWLEKAEHPNRTSAADALNYFLDDYAYGGTITKTGNSGSAVSFNPDTETATNKNYITNLISYTLKGKLYPRYYYDNEDNSYAKSMSELEISNINAAGGIIADGSGSVNVFYRRLRYNLTIGYKSSWSASPSCTKTFLIRFDETVGAAIQRNGITVSSPLSTMMDMNTMGNENYYVWDQIWKDDFWNTGDEYIEGGMNGYRIASPEIVNADIPSGTQAAIPDKTSGYTYLIRDRDAGFSLIRKIYLQNLSSAGSTDISDISKFTLDRTEDWKNGSHNWDYFIPFIYNGFSLYRRQIVRASSRTTYFNGNRGGHQIDGHPVAYSADTQWYPAKENSPNDWQLELFYLRNSYRLSFETFTTEISVAPSESFESVYYEQLLSTISDDIKDGSGNPFVIDETTYVDDQNRIMTFKGWFDNAPCEGDPVDFTSYQMPDHSVILYAKWEPKLIDITFDADGGTIQGEPSVTIKIYSGTIPDMSDEPIPATGELGKLEFFSWTLNGGFYDFTEPLYDNTTLVALYYADPADPLKITYKPGAGKGDDVVEFESYGYLYNANAGVQDFEYEEYFGDWKKPKGRKFTNWSGSDSKDYDPYDEIIMKDDVDLTALYENGNADIIINRKGLLPGESATYAVYKGTGDTKVLVMTVSLTGTTAESVSRKLISMDPDTYTVEETSWSWAYAKDDTTVKEYGKTAETSSTPGTGVGAVDYNETLEFTFTGDPIPTVTTKHGEHVIPNEF